jgi:hypothetical protein
VLPHGISDVYTYRIISTCCWVERVIFSTSLGVGPTEQSGVELWIGKSKKEIDAIGVEPNAAKPSRLKVDG